MSIFMIINFPLSFLPSCLLLFFFQNSDLKEKIILSNVFWSEHIRLKELKIMYNLHIFICPTIPLKSIWKNMMKNEEVIMIIINFKILKSHNHTFFIKRVLFLRIHLILKLNATRFHFYRNWRIYWRWM